MAAPADVADSQASWIHETGIPAFRAHVRAVPDAPPVVVTNDDLATILANIVKYAGKFHGGKIPITEGHRNLAPDAKEADQPLTLGYSDNWRSGQLPDGTPAILCDRHYMAKYADRATRHPHTSIEYLPISKVIIGLAKLTRPPELNLGSVYYPTGEPVYVYAASMGDGMDEKPGAESKPEEKPALDAPTAPVPELTPEEMAGSEKVYAYLCSKYAWMAACAKKYANGDSGAEEPEVAEEPDENAAEPQANNTAVPKEIGDDDEAKKKKKLKPETEETPTMSAATLEKVQQYEAELAAMKSKQAASDAKQAATETQFSALLVEREKEKIGRLLDQLEHVEHYQFDRATEEAAMIAMTAADREKRAASIRQFHHRLPGHEQVQVYQGVAEGPVPPSTDEQMKRAVKHASKNGISYDEAIAAVKAGKA